MRSGIPDPGIPSDWLILTVFVNSGAFFITYCSALETLEVKKRIWINLAEHSVIGCR